MRRQASRFKLSPVAKLVKTVCLLLGALCLVFIFAEMKETSGIRSLPAAGVSETGVPAKAEGGGGGEAEEPGAAASEPLHLGVQGGLRRFRNFTQYVVRAETKDLQSV